MVFMKLDKKEVSWDEMGFMGMKLACTVFNI